MEIGLIAVFLCEGILIIFGFYLIWSWINQTPFYPSKTKPLNDLLKELNITGNINFIDIGSGDGRIVRWAAKQGFNADGIEFNPFLTLYSRSVITLKGLRNRAKIFNKDFRNHDFSKYDFAYLYIFPEHMDSVSNKLFSEMKKGSVVVTNTFKFTKLTPDRTFGKYYIYYVK